MRGFFRAVAVTTALSLPAVSAQAEDFSDVHPDNTDITLAQSFQGGAVSACDPMGELSPSDHMRPGQSIWIGKGDLSSSEKSGRIPFCTNGDWVERYGYQDKNLLFCTVDDKGLFVGHESSDPRNTAPVDPNTGRKPDTKPAAICRTRDGTCVLCPALTS